MASAILPALLTELDQMTIEELERERAYWMRFIHDRSDYGMTLAIANDCLLACEAQLTRRRAEPANGKIAGPVTLSHRVPVIGTDPVVES